VTEVETAGGGAAALIYQREALDDRGLRNAVLAAVRLAVTRLGLAAEAAAQLDALAASRARLAAAAVEERDRFAADVATGPGALLVGAARELDAAGPYAPVPLAELLQGARDELKLARRDLKATVSGDIAATVGARGLEASLHDLARRAGTACDIRLGGLDPPEEVAVAAWYVAAEAVANALKHAHAATIAIAARSAGQLLVIEVADDGVGGADAGGRGLTGLAIRVTEKGGRLAVASRPGGGTIVSARLPLSAGASTVRPS
jgi:signal transduction histidine kinase